MSEYNAFRKAISEKFVASFVGKTMLSYSFSTAELYNILHNLEFDLITNANERSLYERSYQTRRSYNRVERIAARLTDEKTACAGVIFHPKIYDQEMFDHLPLSYNRLATSISRPTIKVVTESFLHRADINDAYLWNDYQDELVACGYCVDTSKLKRKGLTLPEVMLYASLYMSTHSRSVLTLNMSLNQKRDYIRAEKWHNRTIEQLNSKALYGAIIYELMDMLFFEVMYNYIDFEKQHLQAYWLAEKYRDRKDRDRVLKKLDKMVIDDKISTFYLSSNLDLHPEQVSLFIEQSETLRIAERLLADVLLTAELVLFEILPNNLVINNGRVNLSEYINRDSILKEHLYQRTDLTEHSVEEEDYRLAVWLAHLFQSMFEEGHRIACKMIDCLPEAVAWKQIE